MIFSRLLIACSIDIVSFGLINQNRRDGVVVRASASQSIYLGFISSSRVIPKHFKKMVFTAFLLGAQHKRDKNKQASLLVVSLGKPLNRMPPSLGGRQVVGPRSCPSWCPGLTEDSQAEHELLRSVYISSCIMLCTIAQTATINQLNMVVTLNLGIMAFLDSEIICFQE